MVISTTSDRFQTVLQNLLNKRKTYEELYHLFHFNQRTEKKENLRREKSLKKTISFNEH